MMHYGDAFMWGGGGWLMFLVFAVLVIVPFWRLLPRFGIPAWVAIFAIFPLVALILLWIMAFRDEAGPRGN